MKTLASASKPRVFIASAGASLRIARWCKASLSDCSECEVWDEAEQFKNYGTNTTLEALQMASWQSDFALFVASPDDNVQKNGRGKHHWTMRDNVLFEIGLFLPILGRDRMAIVLPSVSGREAKVPSDLEGLTRIPFEVRRRSGAANLAAIEKALNGFKNAIKRDKFIQHKFVLANGWGWMHDPERFEVCLDRSLLPERRYLLRGRRLAMAGRLDDQTVNFESDPHTVFSDVRPVPEPIEDIVLSIELTKFRPRKPALEKDKMGFRVITVPDNVKLQRCRSLDHAISQGCRVIEQVVGYRKKKKSLRAK